MWMLGNPITASRMAKVFSRCGSYGAERQRVMREAIDLLASLSPLRQYG
jgi:aminopeptidase N